eukprot:TRINITY_DN4289_c0_g1_i1.p1 TRINITY_DN4289_c0_g1~~TRINITY_DN4289_c0_g1_i1.p1  ORF type:complete len:191 (+),score=14.90 TRINITY_DN4289_c0_g1_i1:25-573(+)
MNMQTTHGSVDRWEIKHAGDWMILTGEVGSMRTEALLHVLARISQHEVVVVPPGEECTVMALKESEQSCYRMVMNKKLLIDRDRVKIRKIQHNRVFYSSKEYDPCTSEVLSSLPSTRCTLLGNYALSKEWNVVELVSTSIRAGKRVTVDRPMPEPFDHTCCIRGDLLLIIQVKSVYSHVLEY